MDDDNKSRIIEKSPKERFYRVNYAKTLIFLIKTLKVQRRIGQWGVQSRLQGLRQRVRLRNRVERHQSEEIAGRSCDFRDILLIFRVFRDFLCFSRKEKNLQRDSHAKKPQTPEYHPFYWHLDQQSKGRGGFHHGNRHGRVSEIVIFP